MTPDIQIPGAFRFLWQEKADDGLPVRYRCAHGGRGSAKSMSFARALVIKAAAKKLKVLCFREVQKSVKESVKAEIEQAIIDCGLKGFYNVLETEIRGRNGSEFIFTGLRKSSVSSIKSTKGVNIAWGDEANAISKKSFELLDPTIREPGSEIWLTWNPEDATDPVDSIFRNAILPPGSIVREVNYDDNPWFKDTPLQTIMEYDRRRDPDKYDHVWRGKYQKNSERRVFKNWKVEEFDTPLDAVLRFGADWGFSVDPTVLVRMFIGRWQDGKAVSDPTGRVLFIDHEAYKVGCEIDETPSLFAGTDKEDPPRWSNSHNHPGIPGAKKWLITADSSRPETVSYMKRKGFRIAPAIKGPGSVEDGIEFLKTYDIVVHPRCVETALEFAAYSFKVDEKTGEVLPLLEDKDNHVIDACRYACEAVRRAKKPTVPNRPKTPSDYRRNEQPGGSEWMAA